MPTIRYFGHEKPQKTGCILTLWAYGKKYTVSAQNKMEDWALRGDFFVYAQNKAGFMAEMKDEPVERAMFIE